MSSKFVDEPEKVQRAIDLMKELDDLLKIHPKIKGPDIEKKVKFAEQVRIIEGTDGGTSGEDEEPKNRPLLDTFRELVSEII